MVFTSASGPIGYIHGVTWSNIDNKLCSQMIMNKPKDCEYPTSITS